MALEIIILPFIYYFGYEILMDKQKESFEKDLTIIEERKEFLENEIIKLKKENKELRKRIKTPKN